MIGCFWRTRWFWSRGPEGPKSAGNEFAPAERRTRGSNSTMAELERAFRPEPRTPGPGAAWSGGRL